MGSALFKRAQLALEKTKELGLGYVEDLSIKQERELCESSFYEFAKRAWKFAGSGAEFIETWHIRGLCDHLEEAYKGNIKYLIINIPPRCGKSTLLNVLFPAWVWSREPGLKFLYASHSERLAHRDSDYCRALIKSEWYQKLWGKKYQLTNDTTIKFNNNCTGYRLALSIGSKATGEGADFVIWDDPNNRDDVQSPTVREGTNETWDLTMSTRWINPNRFCRIVSQQRLHQYDVSGHILSQDNPEVVHFCLPYEFEAGRKCETIMLPNTKKEWSDNRKKEGELLWPEQITANKIKELKISLGAYEYANQFQQRGSPAEGGIFKKEWFEWWCDRQPPECDFVLQSWDTAISSEPTACYSACTTWGVFHEPGTTTPNIILLDCWRGRVEMPELLEMSKRLYLNFHDTILEDPQGPNSGPSPDVVLIEAQANGLSLLQFLKKQGIPVTPFYPLKHKAFGAHTNGKIQRARLISPYIEGGRVWLPAKGPNYTNLRGFADRFLESCANFPNDESNDFVDSMSQAIIKLVHSGWVNHPGDQQFMPEIDLKKNKPLY